MFKQTIILPRRVRQVSSFAAHYIRSSYNDTVGTNIVTVTVPLVPSTLSSEWQQSKQVINYGTVERV